MPTICIDASRARTDRHFPQNLKSVNLLFRKYPNQYNFGIHTVLAAGMNDTRLKASGYFTLAEIEGIFGEEIGDINDEYVV